ncbi:MAG: thiamine pyrophosphokinase [Acidobacteria bacterium]|nr:thiamine pyrophosphokinase [Acidobacteriota bacterium]
MADRHSGRAADPWNLIWVMPAEGDLQSSGPAVIFAGGDPVPDSVEALLPRGALVVAADSGLEVARSLGVNVDLVVGDFDSADPASVAAAAAAGARLERHPVAKDATDLELAFETVLRLGRSPVVVVGGAGWDRLDHLLANALLVASPRYRPLHLRWLVKGAEVAPVHGRLDLEGAPGDLVTLLALGGPAAGVTTAGLRWPLAGEALAPGSTRGVSNVMDGPSASVSVEEGVLLALHIRRER